MSRISRPLIDPKRPSHIQCIPKIRSIAHPDIRTPTHVARRADLASNDARRSHTLFPQPFPSHTRHRRLASRRTLTGAGAGADSPSARTAIERCARFCVFAANFALARTADAETVVVANIVVMLERAGGVRARRVGMPRACEAIERASR